MFKLQPSSICFASFLWLIFVIVFLANKIKMEALKSLPRMLQGMEAIHGSTDADHLAQLRKNVRIFIKGVTAEVAEIIEHYQKRIAALERENQMLKSATKMNALQSPTTPQPTRKNNHETSSARPIPLTKNTPHIDRMAVAESHLFNQYSHEIEDDVKFSAILPRHKPVRREEEFPVELISQALEEDLGQGKSHFEAKTNRRKQHEAELRQFLETGSKSMGVTTQKYLESIGRTKKEEEKTDEPQLNREASDSSLSPKKKDVELNGSLSNIFNSLDNSLLAKRSKSGKKDVISPSKQEAINKKKQEEEIAKMMKGIGVKNLLSRLRDNVENSARKQPEPIRCSKLVTCGASPPKQSFLQPNRNSSKVLINPVPVDIARKSKTIREKATPEETERPPAISPTKSILKQSSTILSKSLRLTEFQE